MSFGIKVKAIKGTVLPSNSCPSCNASSLNNIGILKHFHIYGLPIFPVGGQSLINCGACDYSQPFSSAPENIRAQATAAVNVKSMLLSSWRFLVLAALLIAIFVFLQNDKKQNQAYVAAPQAGDIYIVRLDDIVPGVADSAFPYGVLKVTEVSDGQVSVVLANAGYGNLKSVRKSLRQDGSQADFYSTDALNLSASALPDLLDQGAIYDVQR